MAAIMIVTTDYFYRDVTRFIDICNVLAGDDFDPGVFDPADPSEILHGITEALLLWPGDEEETIEFSAEIRAYIGKVMNTSGIVKPFDVLSIAIDGDQSAKVDSTWADDPEMYESIYASQAERQTQMEGEYLETLASTKKQLQLLRLRNGDTSEAVKQIENIENMVRG